MAQHDYVISNGTGAAVRSDLNNALLAIVSNNSGATAPSPTYAYQLWADTTTNLLKLRNGANSAWITVGDLTAANLGLATLASPTFTGTATIPTLTVSTSAGIPLGSAASPTLFFTGDTNTGLYSPGADQVALTTGGTGRLFINSSGSVGIGTSSPISLLHVAGAEGTYGQLRIQGVGTGQSAILAFSTASNGRGIYLDENDSNKLKIYAGAGRGAAGEVTIDNSGRLGIGTTSPADTLHVRGPVSGTILNLDRAGSYSWKLGQSSGSDLTFTGDTSERVRFTSDGKVLVGTSSARANFFNTTLTAGLQVEGTGGSTARAGLSVVNNDSSNNPAYIVLGRSASATLGSNTTVASGDWIGSLSFQGADGSELVEAASIQAWVDAAPGANDMPGRLVFSTTADGASSPTERFRVNSNGQLCINTTTATTGIGHRVFIEDGSTYAPMGVNNTAGGTSSSNNIVIYRAGTQVGSITTTNTATAYNTSSDYRLKENVVSLTGASDRVNQLQVHRFNFIADPDRTVDGFIAHEAQAVVPECVTGEKDAVDDEGNPVYQGIDQSKLVPLLTAALQEALAEIKILKTKVAALEAK